MDDHKSLKAYTRVKKGNVIIFRFKDFVSINTVIKMLKIRDIKDSIDVEHVFIDENKIKIYALHIVRNGIRRAAVFPCGYCRNNTK